MSNVCVHIIDIHTPKDSHKGHPTQMQIDLFQIFENGDPSHGLGYMSHVVCFFFTPISILKCIQTLCLQVKPKKTEYERQRTEFSKDLNETPKK